MDRCRCADYEAAVKKIKFYTVGTYRPDIIENYDRGPYYTTWVRNSVDLTDLRFKRPKGHKRFKPEDLPINRLPIRSQKIENMWCRYMTPVQMSKE
ncbi:hypothetical protein PYW08_010120 [Mythimna loreyi]|uniref:Uncharacterized protein n=1 Tax=Mythimna loreyi TaxID=667449 RepID=A0ACC2Q5H1_9NEOP|nr:hypothetical protein PYW08_010120 [Mythimna loreyi]